eukprot:403348866
MNQSVRCSFDLELELKDKYFYTEDPTGIQKFLNLINYFEFCILPRPTSTTMLFWNMIKRHYVKKFASEQLSLEFTDNKELNNQSGSEGIKKVAVDFQQAQEDGQRLLKAETYRDKIYEMRDDLVIPLMTHRIWMTDPANPNEMQSIFNDQFLVQQLQETNRVLDTEAAKIGKKFTHILWTNDISLIPQTTKFFQEQGFEVRELRSLKSFDKVFNDIFAYYMADFKGIGVACDIARMLINMDQGGVYLDLDAYISQYTIESHFLFDFFGVTDIEFYELQLSTWGFGSKPQHPIHRLHLKYVREFFLKSQQEKPFYLNRCYFQTSGVVLFQTGPFYYTIVGQQTISKFPENQDIILINTSFTKVADNPIRIRDKDGTIRDFTVKLDIKQYGQGSWTNDFLDATIFGWPETQ